MSRRPSLHNPFQPPVFPDVFSDSRTHGAQGPSRHVRIAHATSPGGGAVAKSEDGIRCVVAGKESLRILRISEPGVTHAVDHKSSVGPGGYRIDASRNLWTGSGLKIDSASTDVVWGHGNFNNKILTSARNGELIMWDLQKNSASKYERRVRHHVRSIHKIAYSTVLRDYCVTGSADGDIRVWDLRDLTDCVMKIHHPDAVRSVVFSPVHWQPRHIITGLENGNIYHWDLSKGQRGQLDRIPLAHTGPILSLDWTLPPTFAAASNPGRSSGSGGSTQAPNWYNMGLFDDLNGLASTNTITSNDTDSVGMGWLASGGLDRCVKVWDMTVPAGEAHIARKPMYTLHTSFPVRRVAWRPGYECELAISSSLDIGTGSQANQMYDSSTNALSSSPRVGMGLDLGIGKMPTSDKNSEDDKMTPTNSNNVGNPIEIWDVRRGYVAKWTARGSAVEGGVTDLTFSDSHTLWAQHFSGTFSQLDLRYSMRTLDTMPRSAITWDPTSCLLFVADKPKRFEIPYDDVNPDRRPLNKRKLKSLGAKSYIPTSQTMGVMTGHGLVDDPDCFSKLAQGYVFEGSDRPSICARNADVAFDCGRPDAAQTWLLLGSLLVDIVPPPMMTPATTLSPLPFVNHKLPHALPHSTSAPAAIPTIAHPPVTPHPIRSVSEDPHGHTVEYTSPGSRSNSGGSGSRSRRPSGRDKARTHSTSSTGTGFLSPLRTTPASSTTPSPHRSVTPLPPLPLSVPQSVLARRSSGAGLPASLVTHSSMAPPPTRPRLASSYRRPSTSFASAPSIHSLASEGDSRSQSHVSLKKVGEGALDSDSGSSEEELHVESTAVSDTESPELGRNDDRSRSHSTSEMMTRPRPSPSISSSSNSIPYRHSRASSVQPSPLSRVAVQETWTEDEREEEDSPSPASTDSEDSAGGFDDFPSPTFRDPHPLSRRQSTSSRSTRRSSMRIVKPRSQARSRSSTVASLSVSVLPGAAGSRGRLTKQESRSSIRTVTAQATPTSAHPPERSRSGNGDVDRASTTLRRDSTIRDLAGSNPRNRGDATSVRSSYYSQSRPRSLALSNEGEYDADEDGMAGGFGTMGENSPSSRNAAREAVQQMEAQLREAGWEAMRETLEILIDEGDVQMCTMLALVAADELKIRKARVVRFVESYIDLLMRMRMHAVAAYIRKYVPANEIREKTTTATTIECVCAKCRKPLVLPAFKLTHMNKPSGSFAYCLKCKSATSKCAICHLPVRAMAFTCPVCMHGGHQECYRQYHLRRPVVTISSNASPSLSMPKTLPTPAPPAPAAAPMQRSLSRVSLSEGRSRGRAQSKSGDGDNSDDGMSVGARDSEDSLGATRGLDLGVVDGIGVTISGHPCAAGCGHFCWATNDPLLLANSLLPETPR